MKYLLVLFVVLIGFWLWKHNRRSAKRAREIHRPPPAPPAVTTPADMVACRHCGLHLPKQEAVTGLQGLYCCEAHRAALEG